jgi:DGQHR domain-containing protein
VERADAIARFGRELNLGVCQVGTNLNLQVIRGFARLDQLAIISAPDIYDQVTNPTGTQRLLNKEHAEACMVYASEADAAPAEEKPHFFPEILLNVRTMNVVGLTNPEDPEESYEFTSFSEDVPTFVGVTINLDAMEFPKRNVGPDISRVDGNHRLWGVDQELDAGKLQGDAEQEEEKYPRVSFCLLLGLDPEQEARLFRDINGEHQGMSVVHLAQIEARITSPEKLRAETPELWIANELDAPGRAFANMVFRGGSRTGLKKIGEARPVKLSALKQAIAVLLDRWDQSRTAMRKEPDLVLEIVDNYWKAVSTVFSDAWHDHRNYILLQTIGLQAFAKFGGKLIDEGIARNEVDRRDFERVLKPIADNISLRRDEFKGVAGAGGVKVVVDLLNAAIDPDAAQLAKVKAKLLPEPSIDERLRM